MVFLECDEAISIMYMLVRHLQPERTKKRQRIKVRTTIDDVEGETFDGVDSMLDNWLCNRPDCDE